MTLGQRLAAMLLGSAMLVALEETATHRSSEVLYTLRGALWLERRCTCQTTKAKVSFAPAEAKNNRSTKNGLRRRHKPSPATCQNSRSSRRSPDLNENERPQRRSQRSLRPGQQGRAQTAAPSQR